MRRSAIIALLLLFGLAVPALAQSVGVGGRVSSELAISAHSEWYLSPYFSFGLALGVQSASVAIEGVGRFYSPGYVHPLAFYGGGGARLEVTGSSWRPFGLLLLGAKIGLGFNLNLLGELELVSPLHDLRRFDLEVWFGLEARFRI